MEHNDVRDSLHSAHAKCFTVHVVDMSLIHDLQPCTFAVAD